MHNRVLLKYNRKHCNCEIYRGVLRTSEGDHVTRTELVSSITKFYESEKSAVASQLYRKAALCTHQITPISHERGY